MTKKRLCINPGCRRPLPWPRKKYCKSACQYAVVLINNKRPIVDKVCKFASCGAIFKGNGLQKFCCPEHRVKHQYGITNEAIQRVKESPSLHPCACCEPSKMIPIRQTYCPENAWMKGLTAEEKKFQPPTKEN